MVGNINVNELTKYIKNENAVGRPVCVERQGEKVYLMTSYLALIIPAALYNCVLKESLCEACPDDGKVISIGRAPSTFYRTIEDLISLEDKQPAQLTDVYMSVPDGKKKSKLTRIIAGASCGIAINETYCKIALENGGEIYGAGALTPVVCRYSDDLIAAVCPVRLYPSQKNIADAVSEAVKASVGKENIK